jgi:hypothetical protein
METRNLIAGYGAQYVRARIDTPLEEVLLRFIEPREYRSAAEARR